ncbi:MAG: hypothetical protein LBV55_00705 [Acholeplasmatales bacterium]|jgi:hypothetical protein|nr:hypothetical protein [Acholeplasmatales bacterium]
MGQIYIKNGYVRNVLPTHLLANGFISKKIDLNAYLKCNSHIKFNKNEVKLLKLLTDSADTKYTKSDLIRILGILSATINSIIYYFNKYGEKLIVPVELKDGVLSATIDNITIEKGCKLSTIYGHNEKADGIKIDLSTGHKLESSQAVNLLRYAYDNGEIVFVNPKQQKELQILEPRITDKKFVQHQQMS